MWGVIPKGSKPPFLANFDGRYDLHEHVTSINMQVAIIGAPDSLNCKLLSCTFRDTVLRWYMGLHPIPVNNYQKLVRKMVNHIAA